VTAATLNFFNGGQDFDTLDFVLACLLTALVKVMVGI
jgi:hypothetical protein